MKKKLSAVLSALFLLLCCALPVFAAPQIPQGEETLEVKLAYEKRPLSGVTVTLHRVADITEVSPWITFTLSGEFANYPVKLEDLDSDGWADAAFTLANYAVADDITPDATTKTGADGYAQFDKIEQGLYLVRAEKYVDGKGYRYTAAPTLLELPTYKESDHKWELNAEVEMKVERTPKPEESETDTPDTPDMPSDSVTTTGTSLSVHKVWNSGRAEQPESVTVEVVTEGKSVANAQLTAATGWCHTFTGLDSSKQYSVVERGVPQGYTVTISKGSNGYIITNTAVDYTQAVQPALTGLIPQTGLLWWPVPVLAVLGLLLFAAGWKKHNDSKRDS